MKTCSYRLDADSRYKAPAGLIVLETDETIEPELARYFADHDGPLFVSRVPSGATVTTETLSEMKRALPAAAALLPKTRKYGVVGYGCTSGSSVIGSEVVESLIKQSCDTAYVTNPMQATLAYAAEKGVSRLAMLSPYIEDVNSTLRSAFAGHGLTTEIFGSFNVREEAKVARIAVQSIVDSAVTLGRDPGVEAVFISCTNLRTIDALPAIASQIGKPVMSSNQALAWHMLHLLSSK